MDHVGAVSLPLGSKVTPGALLDIIKVVFHVIDGVVQGARISIHASESLHGLGRDKVTAILIRDLKLSCAKFSFVIWRTTNMSVFIDSAMIPSSGQTCLTIPFVLSKILILI